jgi:hypothetical protein
MNNIFIHIITILIISIVSALIGIAFNRIQQPDMILAPYRRWLEYISNREYKSLRFRWFEFKLWFIMNVTFITAERDHLKYMLLHKDKWYNDSTKFVSKKSKLLEYIVKPLGLCIICNTFWIGVIMLFICTNESYNLRIIDSIITGITSIGIVTVINKACNG